MIDTNVFISFLMFGGLPGSLDLALLFRFLHFAYLPLFDELEGKLLFKFNLSAAAPHVVRKRLTSAAKLIQPDLVVAAVKEDPDDNRVLDVPWQDEPITLSAGTATPST